MTSWLLSLPCTRAEAETLSDEIVAFELLAETPVVATREIDEAAEAWQCDAYFETKPDPATIAIVRAQVPSAARAKPSLTYLPDEDWVTLSQQGLAPVHAGRFYVHTAENRGSMPDGAVAFRIDAGLAFGTGGHDTTAGCLAMLDALAKHGITPGRVVDIGTGTGLLAFAAHALWPRARIIASDIDPVSVTVSKANAAINQVPVGDGTGRIALRTAAGTDHPAIRARAPYDLVIANILAGPLISLAADIASITGEGGRVILAGLVTRQMDAVLNAYRAQGLRLLARGGSAEWPCLLLLKRRRYGWRRPTRALHRASPSDASFGSW